MHPHDPDVTAAITALDLFAGLPAPALDDVTARARVRTLGRGARMFDQGEPVERAHVLLSGAIRIAQAGSEDRKSVVSGKSVSVRVDPGGRLIFKKNTRNN